MNPKSKVLSLAANQWFYTKKDFKVTDYDGKLTNVVSMCIYDHHLQNEKKITWEEVTDTCFRMVSLQMAGIFTNNVGWFVFSQRQDTWGVEALFTKVYCNIQFVTPIEYVLVMYYGAFYNELRGMISACTVAKFGSKYIHRRKKNYESI